MKLWLKTIVAALALWGGPAAAQVLTEYRAGASQASAGTYYLGQSFTIPTAGSFNGFTFNFYSNANNTAVAPGTLFLYNAAYTGTPTQLGTPSASLLGSATGANNVYTFNGVTLSGNTQYFAYSNAASPQVRFGSGGYAGGMGYQANGAGSAFASIGTNDINFTVGAVPEPAAWGLMIVGFGAVGGTLRRRRRTIALAA